MTPTTYTPKLRPTLAEAQAMIGGYVQLVIDEPDMQVLVDEDGLGKQLSLNNKASDLCNQLIVGNAIVLKGKAMWIDDDSEEDMIGEDAYL